MQVHYKQKDDLVRVTPFIDDMIAQEPNPPNPPGVFFTSTSICNFPHDNMQHVILRSTTIFLFFLFYCEIWGIVWTFSELTFKQIFCCQGLSRRNPGSILRGSPEYRKIRTTGSHCISKFFLVLITPTLIYVQYAVPVPSLR